MRRILKLAVLATLSLATLPAATFAFDRNYGGQYDDEEELDQQQEFLSQQQRIVRDQKNALRAQRRADELNERAEESSQDSMFNNGGYNRGVYSNRGGNGMNLDLIPNLGNLNENPLGALVQFMQAARNGNQNRPQVEAYRPAEIMGPTPKGCGRGDPIPNHPGWNLAFCGRYNGVMDPTGKFYSKN